MNMTKILQRIFVTAFIAAVISTPCFAVEYFLRADTLTKTMPGNVDIPMWGFAQDTSFGSLDGDVTVPGPLLTVPEGDSNLIIHLDNNLDVPVSIVINGQITIMTPERNPDGRVRSFTHETPPGNTTAVDYVWTNFRPGTYAYQSGTHVAVQVQMGLYGGVTRDFAAGQIYESMDTVYDVQEVLFFSEIDIALHEAVATGNYGPGTEMTSTIDYEPKYFLINGQPFTLGQAALRIGDPGDTVLLRFFNMGLETRCPLLLNNFMTLIAEDGRPYMYPKEGYVVNLPAGKTVDAIATFPANGLYRIFDRRLGLTNDKVTGGGMLANLQVGDNTAPIINAVTATPASIYDNQTSQLLVDAMDTDGPSPLSYSWIVPPGAGSVSNATSANPTYIPPDVATSQTFTLTVYVSDDMATVSGTVDVTVVENAAPVINSITATPTSILETQTSQLLVDAADTDGPSPLSYNWIVPVGAGSVSDAGIANPIYTPSDVTATQIFTLTIEVFDGLLTTTGTVDITVHNLNAAPIINSVTATPASILDTQTSQLLADAADTDGPSPLSYNWIIPVGAGSVNNTAIANPIYTPPIVAAVQIFTLTVEVSDGMDIVSSSVEVTVSHPQQIFSASFDAGTDSFGYSDNTFRGTSGNGFYERGDRITTGGFTGGALRVRLGGLDNNLVSGMSGGWSRTFTLAAPAIVDVSFQYNLAQTANYENTEFSDMMLAIDGVVIGAGANDYLARITGNGNGGPILGNVWQLFNTPVSLPAGTHTITIGGYNNQKDNSNEMTTILIDDVVLMEGSSGPGVNVPPTINSVTATPASITDDQISQLLVNASDTDGPSPLNFNWVVPVGAGSVDNAAAANPIYTPPAVVITQVFTLTIEVSDGQDTTVDTVDVAVNPAGNAAPIINSVTATPASILDTEISQLLVDAADTDGPSPLSYNWIVPIGAGSVSDPAIANPIYTPPDVIAAQLFTLTVEVSDGLTIASSFVDVTVSDAASPQPIFSASFDTGTDSFGYSDNTFRDTTGNGYYERGDRITTGGFSGGALRIRLGGLDNNLIVGMSGGWSRTFTLAAPAIVDVSFQYNLAQTANYENTEFSDMMLAIDGVVIGAGANDYLASITGNGDGGSILGNTWQLYTTSVNLPAGTHTITIGGYNNQKDNSNEMTTILIDDVSLTGN